MPLQLLDVGLDGADWAILNPWLGADDLPHFANLVARQAWGPLRSTPMCKTAVGHGFAPANLAGLFAGSSDLTGNHAPDGQKGNRWG